MILAIMLGAPWWLILPAYFLIGAAWAFAYLPRSITLQARAYQTWRNEVTDGRPLAEALVASGTEDRQALTPEKFLQWRDVQVKQFTERPILRGFILNIAFWPIRLLERFVVDILFELADWLCKALNNLWHHVIVAFARWSYRTLRRGLEYLWRNVLAPMYTWVYRRFTAVYQAIIRRANREALADMEILNRTQEEKK